MVRAAAISTFLTLAAVSSACMGVGPVGVPVRFDEQTNIVIWDRVRGMEHFVRDARFETSGASLGFIAPTPGRPGVFAVDRAAFDLVGSLGPDVGSGGGFGGGGMGGFGGGRSVTVVERKSVAGYEATVLRAADPQALTAWLRDNGYDVPRYAARWAAPYVRRGWYFTAFKVAAGGGAGATGPVRLTFKTDVPFNPYAVPAENQGRGGLSLYYISPGAEEGRIGGTAPWAAPRWSKELSDDNARKLEADLKLNANVMPPKSVVRFYRDPSFGRPGVDDVYFVPSKPSKPSSSGSTSLLTGLGASALLFVGVGAVSARTTRS